MKEEHIQTTKEQEIAIVSAFTDKSMPKFVTKVKNFIKENMGSISSSAKSFKAVDGKFAYSMDGFRWYTYAIASGHPSTVLVVPYTKDREVDYSALYDSIVKLVEDGREDVKAYASFFRATDYGFDIRSNEE